MTTKNLLAGLSILAIAGLWTGCSNDESVGMKQDAQRAISFRVQGGPSTRTTGTPTDYVNAFVVSAQGDQTSFAKPTLDGVTVYRMEGSASIFDYNPKAYFDNSDTEAYFSAYSPVSKNITTGLAGTTDNTIAYQVLAPDNTGKTTQEDLLVAYTFVADTKTPNEANNKTNVTMNFKHALSRVFVQARNSLTSGLPVTISEISLHNLHNAGTLDIDGTAWTGSATFTPGLVSINDDYIAAPAVVDDYKVLWSPTSTQNNTYTYILPGSGISLPKLNPVAWKYITSMEQGMMVLPQATTYPTTPSDTTTYDGDKAFYLQITYSVANVTNTVKIPYEDLHIAGESLTFEMGKQYALALDFTNANVNLVEIKFTVIVEDWQTPVDVNVTP